MLQSYFRPHFSQFNRNTSNYALENFKPDSKMAESDEIGLDLFGQVLAACRVKG
jgi:hypothetical protein